MIEKELLVIGNEEVTIDPNNLKFSEQTLSDYLMKEAAWYDNFGAYLAKAEKAYQLADEYHDNIYCLKFYQFKEEGGSDKFVEARAKIDPDVRQADKEKTDAKYVVSRLKNHLRAWDKNHDNAQSMGHTLRREMNRLGNDIRESSNYGPYEDIENIVKHIDPEEL